MEVGTIILLEIRAVHESLHGPKRTRRPAAFVSAFGGIVLQKSKVAGLRIFRENT
jgi:hypothetical protein